MNSIRRCVIGAGEKEGLVRRRPKDPSELCRPSVRSRSTGSFCAAILGDGSLPCEKTIYLVFYREELTHAFFTKMLTYLEIAVV